MKENQQPGPFLPKATGPRTLKGKNRSRKNALTHGICTKQLLLAGERPEDFNSLVRALREDFHVEGAFAECLIVQLAMVLWRKGRLLKAEAAEIARVAEFLRRDRSWQQSAMLRCCDDELVAQESNPLALQRAIERLTQLHDGFESLGFEETEDVGILDEIYGQHKEGFPQAYLGPAVLGRRSEAIRAIDKELVRFKSLKNEIDQSEASRLKYAEVASLVPQPAVQEHLQRYESHLSRETDRLLSQLERAKRLRRRSPLPPSITLTHG